jgi:hypothetical protein
MSFGGPTYNFADELRTPSELGIGRDGSFGGIMRAVGGINYYTDAIGFGESTMIARSQGMNQKPLGINYFMKTGQICSNGADEYEYITSIPSGLPGRVGKEVQKTLGVSMRGLAPGIVEDAAKALNPMPYFQAAIGSGYVQCKKITRSVGDLNGSVKSSFDPNNVWIKDAYTLVNGKPHQTQWVFDKYISMEEYDAAKKTEAVPPVKEGFGTELGAELSAGILFALLFLGIVAVKANT